MEETRSGDRPERRVVPANLIEATPGGSAIGHWVLASPLLIFVAWLWLDIFAYYSPLPRPVDWLLGGAVYLLLFILPLGLLAHLIITSLPRPFQNAGWDVQPLERVSEAEQYIVRYSYRARRRAPTTWSRLWMRAAQGWVYLEIAVILVGAVAMIPLFFSAADFGFGQ